MSWHLLPVPGEPGRSWRVLEAADEQNVYLAWPGGSLAVPLAELGLADEAPRTAAAEAGSGQVAAPCAGRVVRLEVAVGSVVVKGDRIATIEAMKMEFPVLAPIAGRVASVLAAPGDKVAHRAAVVTIAPTD